MRSSLFVIAITCLLLMAGAGATATANVDLSPLEGRWTLDGRDCLRAQHLVPTADGTQVWLYFQRLADSEILDTEPNAVYDVVRSGAGNPVWALLHRRGENQRNADGRLIDWWFLMDGPDTLYWDSSFDAESRPWAALYRCHADGSAGPMDDLPAIRPQLGEVMP